ncbi:MAG: hypothetical protein L3J20_04600 [Flavobacteriaceae bacterium]|nr:hypothetical protein [Flavobacteriaceae bacterium]
MSVIKNISILWLIPFLIIGVFLLQYTLAIIYIEEMFKYANEEVKKIVISEENKLFYIYIIQKGVTVFLQFIGSVICLNIGFLYFNYKIPIKDVIKLVLKSFIALIIVQLSIITIVKFSNMTFTMGSIMSFEEKLNITYYANTDSVAIWLLLPLQTINLTQFLIILFLTFSIRVLIKSNYNKAFLFTIKTYGTGMLLWFVFAMIMEMNFS